MPIHPFLCNESFDPETAEAMSQAFSEVRSVLGLSDATDQITDIVAARIIELAKEGLRNKTALVIRTMEEFKANPQ